MGLFSRRKKDDRDPRRDEAVDPEPREPQEPDADAGPRAEGVKPDGAETDGSASDGSAPAQSAPGEAAPEVNISVSSFQGLGAAGAPVQPAAPRDQGPRKAPRAPERPPLPAAPAAPPTQLETVPGLRDNALVRDALAALRENPSGPQVLGVLRQVLQGHLYLRVQGDARQQLADGGQITFGVARAGDKDYMLAYSSGAALRDAVKADGDTGTSAIGQPEPRSLTGGKCARRERTRSGSPTMKVAARRRTPNTSREKLASGAAKEDEETEAAAEGVDGDAVCTRHQSQHGQVKR